MSVVGSECGDGMCWAKSLGAACDYWKVEVERLRDQCRQLDGLVEERELEVEQLQAMVRAALDGTEK